MTKISAHSAH